MDEQARAEIMERWTTRVASTLDGSGWRQAEFDAEHHPADAPPRQWSIAAARGLLAYRDKLAAGLSEPQALGLRGEADLRATPGFEWLRDVIGVVDGDCDLTDFGREIVRVLAEEDTA